MAQTRDRVQDSPMLAAARSALEAGEPIELLAALEAALADGATARALTELGLTFALRPPLRGARWTHALLALATASSLGDRLGDDVGLPAIVSALHFLCGSRPGPARPERPRFVPSTRIAWFEAGVGAGLGGWGHHPIVARTAWDLTERFPHLADDVRTACVAHWTPPEREARPPARSPASGPAPEPGTTAPPLPSSGVERAARVSEARVREVLAGEAEETFAAALDDGEPPIELAAAAAVAAARACAVMAGLRQVHGVTVSRALLEAVTVEGLDVRPAVLGAARFVADGWRAALASGRVAGRLRDPRRHRPISPDDATSEVYARLAAPLELTLSWGHPLKLVDACRDLAQRLPEDQHEWLTSALEGSSRTWPESKRPWLQVGGRHV